MKKTLALLLALLTCFSLLAGCAKDETPDTPDPAPSGENKDPQPNQDQKPEDSKKEPFTYYYVRTLEDTSISNHDSGSNANIALVDYIAGLLYRYKPNADGTKEIIVPGLADGEPTTTDGGTTWRIKLRSDAKWANGEPITADDLIYSWKWQIDPNLMYGQGTGFSSNFITIKNATEYYRQVSNKKPVAWEDVGVKKVDDLTVEITCTKKFTVTDVMRHFQMRCTSPVYEPIYSKCISADGMECTYGTTQDLIMCAGMFKVESWTKGTECIMVKNELWPHADEISIDRIVSRVVTDESTRIELFESGQSDYVELGTNGMAKYGEDPRVQSYYGLSIISIEYNYSHSTKPYLADPIFRKAMFYATDRNAIAKLVNGDPSPFFLSRRGAIFSDGTRYRETPEAQAVIDKNAPNGGYDPALAKKYFDETLKKYNLDKIEVELVYTEGNDGQRQTAEYMQANLPKVFGEDKFEMKLAAMTMSARSTMANTAIKAWLEKGEKSDTYDMFFGSWGLTAERYMPWKKFEKYTSWIHSFAAYDSDAIDTLFKLSETDEYRLDQQKLLKLTVDLEEAFYDDMIDNPIYSATGYAMFSERIQPAVKNYCNGFFWEYCTLK